MRCGQKIDIKAAAVQFLHDAASQKLNGRRLYIYLLTMCDIKTLWDTSRNEIVAALPTLIPDVIGIITEYHISGTCEHVLCACINTNVPPITKMRDYLMTWRISSMEYTDDAGGSFCTEYALEWDVDTNPWRVELIKYWLYDITSMKLCEWIMSGNLGRILWKKYRHPAKQSMSKYIPMINEIASDIEKMFCEHAQVIIIGGW